MRLRLGGPTEWVRERRSRPEPGGRTRARLARPVGLPARRPARLAAPRLRRPGDPGPGQAAGRGARRAGQRADAAARGRAAVPRPGRAQGRRDEVRPGAQPVRVGAARGHRRPVPGAPVPAAGCRSADADLPGPCRAQPRAGPRLAGLVRRLRPAAGRRRLDRAGAPGDLGRRPGRGGQGAVPRRRRGAPLRPEADRPAVQGDGAAGRRDGRRRPGRRADGPGERGTGLHPGGGRAAAGRRGLRRQRRVLRARGAGQHLPGDGQRVGGRGAAVHRGRPARRRNATRWP